MKRIAAVFIVFVMALVGTGVMAAGTVDAGKALAKKCSCHKKRADLNGVPAAELTAKMKDLQAGKGPNKAMINIMKKYSDEDIDNLAAYYSSLK